jgi:hypothetical protein
LWLTDPDTAAEDMVSRALTVRRRVGWAVGLR